MLSGRYMPTTKQQFSVHGLIKKSVDQAYNTNIVDIIIAGDFNFNMALNSDKKKN